MTGPYSQPRDRANRRADLRHAREIADKALQDLRRRIRSALHTSGGMRGPVRHQQRRLSRALEAADAGDGVTAARIVLREAGVR